jgi:hypothetical protein
VHNHGKHDILILAKQMRVKREPMNVQEDKLENAVTDELNAHYDLDYGKAKPNRFATRFAQEQVMVVLDADIAAIFPTSEAVNEALRVLATAAQNLPGASLERPREQRESTAAPRIQE